MTQPTELLEQAGCAGVCPSAVETCHRRGAAGRSAPVAESQLALASPVLGPRRRASQEVPQQTELLEQARRAGVAFLQRKLASAAGLLAEAHRSLGPSVSSEARLERYTPSCWSFQGASARPEDIAVALARPRQMTSLRRARAAWPPWGVSAVNLPAQRANRRGPTGASKTWLGQSRGHARASLGRRRGPVRAAKAWREGVAARFRLAGSSAEKQHVSTWSDLAKPGSPPL